MFTKVEKEQIRAMTELNQKALESLDLFIPYLNDASSILKLNSLKNENQESMYSLIRACEEYVSTDLNNLNESLTKLAEHLDTDRNSYEK